MTEISGIGIEQILGITAGVFTSASLLPQLIKMFRHKKVDDVSVFMLIILMIGLILWILYGIMKSDLPIIITNSFSVLVNSLVLTLRLKYGRKR